MIKLADLDVPGVQITELIPLRRRILSFVRGRRKRTQLVILPNGRQCKRVELSSADEAREVANCLQAVACERIFPQIYDVNGNILLVEYIDGQVVTEIDLEQAYQLGTIYGRLSLHNSKLIAPEEAVDALTKLSEHLVMIGVLNHHEGDRVRSVLVRRCNEDILFSMDYYDPLPFNFVMDSGGNLRIIDIESVVCFGLSGAGITRALDSWMTEDHWTHFLRGYSMHQEPAYIGRNRPLHRMFYLMQTLIHMIRDRPWDFWIVRTLRGELLSLTEVEPYG